MTYYLREEHLSLQLASEAVNVLAEINEIQEKKFQKIQVKEKARSLNRLIYKTPKIKSSKERHDYYK